MKWFLRLFLPLEFGGGGGGSGSSQFKAQGTPPGFDYQSAQALNQLAIGGDIQSYALSDAAFANQYPALQNAYNQWQANLGSQVNAVGAGTAGQAGVMQGLAQNIAGRNAAGTTSDINAIRNAAATAAGAVSPIYGAGASQMGMAQPVANLGVQQAGFAQPISQLGATQAGVAPQLFGLGAQQAGLAQPLANLGANLGFLGGQQAGIGQQINQQAGGIYGAAQMPLATGQQLLQEPIDPQTQQQMMRAGLGAAAGALGGASLGQGMAGQAAAARQLGLNTLQYGQAMRGEAMGDINQYANMIGQGGQLQNLGQGAIGAGGQTMGLGGQMTGLAGQQLQGGGQLYGLGGQQLGQAAQTYGLGAQQLGAGAQTLGLGANILGQGAQTYGLGAQTAGQAGQLSSQAQAAQDTYAMNTANMANIYGNLQNQQATNLMLNMQTAGNLFQKRPYGLGGTNMAQTELGQAGAYNSFQQANYATMNGIAFNQAQLATQQQQISASQNAATTGALVSAGSTAAIVAATAAGACWIARKIYGISSHKWRIFRHWLMNKAPRALRRAYLRHGAYVSQKLDGNRFLSFMIRQVMNLIINRTHYLCLPD